MFPLWASERHPRAPGALFSSPPGARLTPIRASSFRDFRVYGERQGYLRYWQPSRCTGRPVRNGSTVPERWLLSRPLQALRARDGANIPVPRLPLFGHVAARNAVHWTLATRAPVIGPTLARPRRAGHTQSSLAVWRRVLPAAIAATVGVSGQSARFRLRRRSPSACGPCCR